VALDHRARHDRARHHRLGAHDLPDRSELFTIVANGSNVAGAAARNVERLRAIGYTDIAPRNGTGIAEFTTVYFADGLRGGGAAPRRRPRTAAVLRRADRGMPTVLDLPDGVELVAYIGLDRA
jgi:hypothetical protein